MSLKYRESSVSQPNPCSGDSNFCAKQNYSFQCFESGQNVADLGSRALFQLVQIQARLTLKKQPCYNGL